MVSLSSNSYYDIDAILAEEELIPCITLFDFSHLAQLDPDARNRHHFLPEASRLKVPLWAVNEWAMLGFVRLSLPRHYGRKARESLEADPGDADLRYVIPLTGSMILVSFVHNLMLGRIVEILVVSPPF
jgi:GINS complex subunit 3